MVVKKPNIKENNTETKRMRKTMHKIDLSTLPTGTKFYVRNGCYYAQIVEKDGNKYIETYDNNGFIKGTEVTSITLEKGNMSEMDIEILGTEEQFRSLNMILSMETGVCILKTGKGVYVSLGNESLGGAILYGEEDKCTLKSLLSELYIEGLLGEIEVYSCRGDKGLSYILGLVDGSEDISKLKRLR